MGAMLRPLHLKATVLDGRDSTVLPCRLRIIRLYLGGRVVVHGKHAARAALFGVLCVCESLLCLV